MVLKTSYQVNEVEVSYVQHPTLKTNPKISSSKDAFDAFIADWNPKTLQYKEEFKVMYLNRSNRVIGIYRAHMGGIVAVTADPRVIFVPALKLNATQIILAHNHPSGNIRTSRSDLELTRVMKDAGKILEVEVRDHLIIGVDAYTSFADDGLL